MNYHNNVTVIIFIWLECLVECYNHQKYDVECHNNPKYGVECYNHKKKYGVECMSQSSKMWCRVSQESWLTTAVKTFSFSSFILNKLLDWLIEPARQNTNFQSIFPDVTLGTHREILSKSC